MREEGYYWVKTEFNGITDWIICDYLGEGVWFHCGECINGRAMEIDENRITRPDRNIKPVRIDTNEDQRERIRSSNKLFGLI